MSNFSKALFITLIALAFLIEGSYKAGVFYKNHLHEHVTKVCKSTVAFIITMALLTKDGIIHLYNNRQEYITQLNTFRNKVGEFFTYPNLALT